MDVPWNDLCGGRIRANFFGFSRRGGAQRRSLLAFGRRSRIRRTGQKRPLAAAGLYIFINLGLILKVYQSIYVQNMYSSCACEIKDYLWYSQHKSHGTFSFLIS